jgi:hypothetical protein
MDLIIILYLVEPFHKLIEPIFIKYSNSNGDLSIYFLDLIL